MKRLGKVLHLSKSGNLIVRLESSEPPSVGTRVCNSKIQTVGIVNSILGPTKAPYASIQTSMEKTVALAGRVLYLLDRA